MSFGEFYTAFSGLGEGYSRGLEIARQREAAKAVGDSLMSGDYTGAARTAFGVGDTQTGLGLLKLGQAYTKDAREQAAQAEIARGFGSFFGGGDGGGSGALGPLGSATGGGQGSRLPSFATTSGPAGDYIANLFKRESNNNPTAQAPTSSARGLGQFTTGTWNGLARSRPDLGLTPVADGQDGRTDPEQMLRATRAFTGQNEDILRRSNLPVNDATRYSLHFLGAAGGPRFVAGTLSNPDKPAASYVSPEQVAANRRVFFNRDGTAKTAGQVMADFSRSFGGGAGGAPAVAPPQRVAYADDEAQVQALEARMGMVPQAPRQAVQQVASADPAADMPVADAQEARFEIPPAPASPFPPGIGGSGRLSPAVPPSAGSPAALALGGSAEGGRAMTMPGDAAPVHVAQAGGQSVVSDTQVGGAPVQSVMARPTTERLRFLGNVLASPNASAAQREVASTLFKQTLDETRMPDSVKEYVWARANGMTQAKSPGEYNREKSERDEGTKIQEQVAARRAAAAEIGLTPGSPAFQSFTLTGKMPREDEQKLTAGDKKAINEAEDQSINLGQTIDTLNRAKELNGQTFTGRFSAERAAVGSSLPDGWVPDFVADRRGAEATREFGQIMSMEAIKSMSQTLKGATTDREMARFMEILGDPTTPPDIRGRTIDRMLTLAQRQRDLAQSRLEDLRGGTYYRPGGGLSGRDARPAPRSGDRRALSAPSSANRPGAPSAEDRFGQLVGSGMTKQQAFERMEGEGY